MAKAIEEKDLEYEPTMNEEQKANARALADLFKFACNKAEELGYPQLVVFAATDSDQPTNMGFLMRACNAFTAAEAVMQLTEDPNVILALMEKMAHKRIKDSNSE